MSTSEHEPRGIHAKRIEADNVASGVQIQGGDAQTASSLIHLAQSIQQGKISAEEIKARNLVSGLQYIADPTQASVEDLRGELLALRAQLEQAIASHEFSDPPMPRMHRRAWQRLKPNWRSHNPTEIVCYASWMS